MSVYLQVTFGTSVVCARVQSGRQTQSSEPLQKITCYISWFMGFADFSCTGLRAESFVKYLKCSGLRVISLIVQAEWAWLLGGVRRSDSSREDLSVLE